MLHGCTQDPATFAAATLMNRAADRHGFVVVYPGQNRRRNAQGCWNWFLAEHQRRDQGEPAAIAATVCELIDANSLCTIDAARVISRLGHRTSSRLLVCEDTSVGEDSGGMVVVCTGQVESTGRSAVIYGANSAVDR